MQIMVNYRDCHLTKPALPCNNVPLLTSVLGTTPLSVLARRNELQVFLASGLHAVRAVRILMISCKLLAR